MSVALAPAPSRCRPHQYRARKAFKSPLWAILTDHFDTFVSVYEGRYRSTHGPLRREVEKAFFEFKQCGDPNLGVTLFKCESCDTSMAVPFSCKTRICPSCIARKAESTAIHLLERLPEVTHRHLVFSLPKKMGLRQRILEDRNLLRKMTRIVHRVIRRHMVTSVKPHRNRREELKKAKPGIIVALHTWGDDLDGFHPHLHLCISDGVFDAVGGFYPMLDWQVAELREALRRAILKAFVRWQKLSPEAADTLVSWDVERCGFSLFVGPPIDDRARLGGLLRYLLRSPDRNGNTCGLQLQAPRVPEQDRKGSSQT